MGSNRKLIFGAVLVVAGLVFWGLMTALGNLNGKGGTANRVAANNAAVQTISAPAGGRMVAHARSNIPQGTLVTKDMIEMRELKGGGPTTAFITDPLTQAVGYITSTRIPKDAMIRPDDDFVGHISEVGIAGMLQSGRRAMVIPFANKPTLHDLVAIGDRVDVNAAFDGQEARTIVPDVRVLAVDVFGADFPQVNIARRGAYRADAKGGAAPAPGQAPVAPGSTPTPTPTPGPGGARPDPAITLEVTPEQANRILLAQASAGVLDFVVLPTRNATIVGSDGGSGSLGGLPVGERPGLSGGLTPISAVTKAQIAPFAERKKNAGGGSGTRVASSNSNNAGGGGSTRPSRFDRVPVPEFANPNRNGGTSELLTPLNPNLSEPPRPPAESPTYNIPIYADGRTVRVETVQRPQE